MGLCGALCLIMDGGRETHAWIAICVACSETPRHCFHTRSRSLTNIAVANPPASRQTAPPPAPPRPGEKAAAEFEAQRAEQRAEIMPDTEVLSSRQRKTWHVPVRQQQQTLGFEGPSGKRSLLEESRSRHKADLELQAKRAEEIKQKGASRPPPPSSKARIPRPLAR